MRQGAAGLPDVVYHVPLPDKSLQLQTVIQAARGQAAACAAGRHWQRGGYQGNLLTHFQSPIGISAASSVGLHSARLRSLLLDKIFMSFLASKVPELAAKLADFAEVRVLATPSAQHFFKEEELPPGCRPLLGAACLLPRGRF